MDLDIIQNCSGNVSKELHEHATDYYRHVAGRIIGTLITVLIASISIAGNVAVVIVSFQDEILRAQVGNVLISDRVNIRFRCVSAKNKGFGKISVSAKKLPNVRPKPKQPAFLKI